MPKHRLALTLRYLATGRSYRDLAFSFRLGKTTVSEVVRSTTNAIYEVLYPVYLKTPSTEDEWRDVAQGFGSKWQMPNCVGAIDGKHILLKKPPKSGSIFYNYKGGFSIILLAVCDWKYRITYAKFGDYGRDSDGGIFDRCDLKAAMLSGQLNLPSDTLLPRSNIVMPYFFPLGGANLSPAQRIYNYVISRARRMIENVFGIMAQKWRVLLKPIEADDHAADNIVKAVCALHNFLCDESPEKTAALADQGYDNEDNGTWRQDTPALDPVQREQLRARNANNAPRAVKEQRQRLIDYVNGPGAVPWQERYANVPMVPADQPVRPVHPIVDDEAN